jgi:hypothetical protein
LVAVFVVVLVVVVLAVVLVAVVVVVCVVCVVYMEVPQHTRNQVQHTHLSHRQKVKK